MDEKFVLLCIVNEKMFKPKILIPKMWRYIKIREYLLASNMFTSSAYYDKFDKQLPKIIKETKLRINNKFPHIKPYPAGDFEYMTPDVDKETYKAFYWNQYNNLKMMAYRYRCELDNNYLTECSNILYWIGKNAGGAQVHKTIFKKIPHSV